MFKAETILKASKIVHEETHADETASWVHVFAYQKKWAQTYPNDKYGSSKAREFKRLQESAVKAHIARDNAYKKYWKNYDFFELKKRQWQDFLVRDEKRIKHCSCGMRDNSRMVQCDDCFNWVHLTCAALTEEQAQALPEFICSECYVKEIKDTAENFIRHEAGEIDDDGNEVPDN
jgi:hypothetical protein